MKRGARVLLLPLVFAAAPAGAQVELRSHERLDAAVQDVTVAGLKVAPEAAGAGPRWISWDRVRRVGGPEAAKAQPFSPLSDKLWRARTRVERGDFPAAEPLLDDLAQTYAAEDGPSSAVIAEGLLRCRLARGAQSAATFAWLWWTSLHEHHTPTAAGAAGGTWIGGTTDLPPVIDPSTGLVAGLPPVWAPGAATVAAANSPEWSTVRNRGGMAGDMAALYEKAARFEAGLETELTLPAATSNGAAQALVREIVLARAGDPDARIAARRALEQRLAALAPRPDGTTAKTKGQPPPRWLEAWCHIGLGRSLVRETDNAERVLGVIELLHLPARFSSDQPFLAGIALADAAVTMAEIGDPQAAAALKGDLVARFPSHPILEWDKLRKITLREPSANSSSCAPPAPSLPVFAGRSPRSVPVSIEPLPGASPRSSARDGARPVSSLKGRA